MDRRKNRRQEISRDEKLSPQQRPAQRTVDSAFIFKMFSVPGWSITAPLKTQTGPVQVPTLPTAGSAKAGDGRSKQKRKREEGDNETMNAKRSRSEQDVEKSKKEKSEQDSTEKAPKNKKKEKREKQEKPLKDKRTGSNSIDVEAGAAARREKKIKAELEKANALASSEAAQENEPVKSAKKDKSKKEKRKSMDDEAKPDDTNGVATSKKDKTEKKAKKDKPEKKEKTAEASAGASRPTPKPTPKLTPLQAQMAAKLASARFRHLNETLYTTPSSAALEQFKKNPETFEEYHSGFRQQVDVWPSNPVDGYLADIKRRGAVKLSSKDKGDAKKGPKALPRTQGLCTIADLGCGDAKLASAMGKSKENLNIKILSYDLHSPSPLVTPADIANLPLEDGSVNVAIFCLALMGTNWPDFIEEAYRILHWKGELWIAEIKSRFGRVDGKNGDGGKGKVVEHSVGNRKKKPRSKMSEAEKKREDAVKQDEDETLAVEVDGVANASAGKDNDETDVSTFVKVLASRGFVLDGDGENAIERGNKMFVKMRFLKASQPSKGKHAKKGTEGATWKPKGKKFLDGKDEEVDESKVLKPCVYKLR